MYMFIVRHGETNWNRDGYVQGRADIPLNSTGIQQARDTAIVFKEMHFKMVITSPLVRTKETASYICEYANFENQCEDERIIEKDFGICDGMFIKERHALFPNGHAEGEESFKMVRKRMIEAIGEYAHIYQDDILIVSHSCAIAALLKELDPIFEHQFVRLKNTSVTIVNHDLKVEAVDLSLEEAQDWILKHYNR